MVVDNADRVNQLKQPFGLDEQQTLSFPKLGKFFLHVQTTTIFQFVFYFSFAVTIAPLIFFRIWHQLVRGGNSFILV